MFLSPNNKEKPLVQQVVSPDKSFEILKLKMPLQKYKNFCIQWLEQTKDDRAKKMRYQGSALFCF